MARRLDGVERPPADALADWTAEGSVAEVGQVNDRSYAVRATAARWAVS